MKNESVRRKVAAYARVSRDSEDLLHSLSNQVSYFSKLIISNSEWEFAGIYVDEGISGTSIKNRDDFLRMMKDAEQGKMDMILKNLREPYINGFLQFCFYKEPQTR